MMLNIKDWRQIFLDEGIANSDFDKKLCQFSQFSQFGQFSKFSQFSLYILHK